MSVISNCLIVGGGIGGMCAAIELAKSGIEVELVELNPAWNVAGAGITIASPSLRVLRRVGVVDEVLDRGGSWSEIDFCGMDGSVVRTMLMERSIGAEDLPAAAGIMRPVLAENLRNAVEANGVSCRAGTTFTEITQDNGGVDVLFIDGRSGRYDLVIGADGVLSPLRSRIFPQAPQPVFTGQGVWRAVVPRTRRNSTMLLGPNNKAGVNPVSETECYLFMVDKRPGTEFLEPRTWPGLLAGLLAEFGGAIAEVREAIEAGQGTENYHINYRPLAGLMLKGPWHNGRIVLLGDAVHATTPHLAMGAGIAIEGAVTLAEELTRCHSLEGALLAYAGRRYDRSNMVVSSSLRLGEIEQLGLSREEHYAVMSKALHALTQPI